MKRALTSIVPALALATLAACGLEGLLNQYGGHDYLQPVSTIEGSFTGLPNPTFQVISPVEEEIAPFDVRVDGGSYAVDLISGNYSALRVRATQSEGILEAFVPELPAEGAVSGVNLDLDSTAVVKLVEGRLSLEGKALPTLSSDLICIMGKKLDKLIDAGGEVSTVREMMGRAAGHAVLAGNIFEKVFQTPVIVPVDGGTPGEVVFEKGALNEDWLATRTIDYTGDATPDTTTAAFNDAFLASLQTFDFSAPPDPDRVRVVLTVNFNAGRLAGDCSQINRFKWVRDEPGRSMFIVGGIHRTSPIQDTRIDALLGNRGGWTPNQIRMYDDGTHGDRQGGDNIWSITFDLPRGIRIGYKYTWGKQGMLWTGTEEWPGNQRILEVVDVNDDGYVLRLDDFGDEATNKDLSNLHPAAQGELSWDEDLNGDGIPESREGPAGDCVPGEWVSPDWVPVLTVSCTDFVP